MAGMYWLSGFETWTETNGSLIATIKAMFLRRETGWDKKTFNELFFSFLAKLRHRTQLQSVNAFNSRVVSISRLDWKLNQPEWLIDKFSASHSLFTFVELPALRYQTTALTWMSASNWLDTKLRIKFLRMHNAQITARWCREIFREWKLCRSSDIF